MAVELYVTVAGIFAVLLLSFFTWRAVKQSNGTDVASQLSQEIARLEERNAQLQRDVDRLKGDIKSITGARDGLQGELTSTGRNLAAAEQELRDIKDRTATWDEDIRTLTGRIQVLNNTISEKDRQLAVAAVEKKRVEDTIAEKDKQLEGLNNQLQAQFENIANRVLGSANERFTTSSGESLRNLLNPLKDRIEQFQNKIDTVHNQETQQRTVLTSEIRRLAEAAGHLGEEADAFAKALRGDSGLRGNWGQETLKRVLEMSGLEPGREYVEQGGNFNIKSEEGRSQRPDFIILLPEGRHFIIDSKVSLVSYEEYERAETDDARQEASQRLATSCRKHVDDLASKEYQHGDSINSHDLVLMFMPIEGAVALALKTDPRLFEHAWKRRILIVSPGTLFLALRTVSSIWRYERQSQNATAIATQAGQLYDKLVGVAGDLNEVSKKIHDAWVAHNSAMSKLATGRGNAFSKAQKLKLLGIDAKKSFPLIEIDGEKLSVEEETDDESAPIAPVPRLVAPEP